LLRQQPELLGVLVLTWFFNFLYGPVEVALPLHVTEDLHSGASLLGLYWTLFGVGAVLGALTVGSLRRLPLWPVTLCIVVGWGLTLVPFDLGVPTSVSVASFALGGVIYGPFTALSFTLFQDRTPAAWLTTILAARGAALLTAAPVGTALGGPLTAVMGPRQVLAVSGIATITLALVAAALSTWTVNRSV
jgi:MFS family permease